MPYIITMTDTRLYADDPTAEFESGAKPVQTRTAVATLDEAREGCADLYADHDGDYTHMGQCADLPESGGTVGPLPDGTVIEVRQVDWATVWASADLPHYASDYRDDEILAAFNSAA